MGLPPRDLRFLTAHERAERTAYTDAMSAMRDPRSDEADLLVDAVLDEGAELKALLCAADLDAPDCDLGMRLKVMRKRFAERVAEEAAQKAAEQIPSDEFETYGVGRGEL